MQLEAFPENTPEGKAFKKGWDTFVKAQHRPDTFWDPVDGRWEDYNRTKYTFKRVGLPQIPLGTDYWAERTILHEVINVGSTSRTLDIQVIWSPRDGYWYHWGTAPPAPAPAPAPGPAPAPVPEVPEWLRQLNADLDALAKNPNLTPEERYQARQALIQRAYGAN